MAAAGGDDADDASESSSGSESSGLNTPAEGELVWITASDDVN